MPAPSFADAAYAEAGARVGDRDDVWASDVVLKINAPSDEEIARLRDGAILASLVSPAIDPDLVAKLAARRITVLAMDAVPRISRAQSLDVLSSMANIAGYRAVIEAAHEFGSLFTGQVTAAGKVPPAKVLVVGAGVAGLAAIGTAGSLGAMVREAMIPRERPWCSDTPSPTTTDIGTLAFDEIWVTEGMPVEIPATEPESTDRPIPRAAAAERRDDPLHHMKPGATSPMHRTETLDVGIVLEGETLLLLDDGSETRVGPGDAVVQRGTNHAWENRSDRRSGCCSCWSTGRSPTSYAATTGPLQFFDQVVG